MAPSADRERLTQNEWDAEFLASVHRSSSSAPSRDTPRCRAYAVPAPAFRYTREVNDGRHESARIRASRRQAWTVRKYVLGHEPCDDLSASTTPDERLAMMWPLALEAWALSGAGVPDYERRETPVRMRRGGPTAS